MRKNIITLLACFLFTNIHAQKIIAVKCGRLLDVRTGKINNDETIIIEDNIIQSITPPGAAAKIKADTIIDLSGYFVLPGMIDCHTHVLLQADVTLEDYNVQILKQSIPYRTIRAVRSATLR